MNERHIKSGQTIGTGLLLGTLFLCLFCILIFAAHGGKFNPAEMYISDMADFPGTAGMVHRIGMTMLIPFRLLFLLYVLYLLKAMGMGESARRGILSFTLISYLGILTMSCYSAAGNPSIHVLASLIYLFSAASAMLKIALVEYGMRQRLGLIIPFSSALVVVAFLLFLVLPKAGSPWPDWFIFLAQMLWLYTHTFKIEYIYQS